MSSLLRVAEAAGPGRRATAGLGRSGGVARAHGAGVDRAGRDEVSVPAASRRSDIDHQAQACSIRSLAEAANVIPSLSFRLSEDFQPLLLFLTEVLPLPQAATGIPRNHQQPPMVLVCP